MYIKENVFLNYVEEFYLDIILEKYNIGMKKVNIYVKNRLKFTLYLKDGKLHKEYGPAKIEYYKNCSIKSKHYFLNNKLHRENFPAEIYYYKNGNVRFEQYYINNQTYRKSGPSIIRYDINKNKELEIYKTGKKIYREDGPSRLEYYKGVLIGELYLNGFFLHRTDGPAKIIYHKNGNIAIEEYYINGKVPILQNHVIKQQINNALTLFELLELKLSLYINYQKNKNELLDLIDSKLIILKLI